MGKMKLGLIVNTGKEGALEFAKELLKFGEDKGNPFFIAPQTAKALGLPFIDEKEWKDQIDVVVSVGGDGTFLHAANFVLDRNIPIFGINLGKLGFLTGGESANFRQEISQIWSGDFAIQKRNVLSGRLFRGDEEMYSRFALNDFVLSKGALAKLVTIDVHVNGREMGEFRADGIITSTPAGSTAYALSAGGPIVPPHVPCMVMAPICAHTLYARPVILSPLDHLTMYAKEGPTMWLSQDGQSVFEVLTGDRVEIELSKEKFVHAVLLPHFDYYELLQRKLMWGFNPIA